MFPFSRKWTFRAISGNRCIISRTCHFLNTTCSQFQLTTTRLGNRWIFLGEEGTDAYSKEIISVSGNRWIYLGAVWKHILIFSRRRRKQAGKQIKFRRRHTRTGEQINFSRRRAQLENKFTRKIWKQVNISRRCYLNWRPWTKKGTDPFFKEQDFSNFWGTGPIF